MWFENLPPVIGNLHLLLLHLPVGFVVTALLIELWSWRDVAARALVGRLLGVNAFASVVTAAAGWILAGRGGYPETALEWHRWAGLGCAVMAVLAWWLRGKRGLALGRVGLVLLAGATVLAGHLGATLTHGEGLISWHRPAAKPRADTPFEITGRDLAEVHPLLINNCVECHGAEKQKGRLRLDSLVAAMAEGRSGEPGIVPGEPEASEVLRRIALPRDDDEAMPPGDHDALTPAERNTLAEWIMGLKRAR